ncbi:MAG: L,D-transpeptidase family protein [Pseudomonadota bacterium]
MSKLAHALLFALALAGATAAAAGDAVPRYTDSGPEPLLARVFEQIEQNRWEAALSETEALVKAYPKFRLGHLIKGDLLLARTRPLKSFGEGGGKAAVAQVADLREEAIARLRAYKNKPAETQVPRYLLQLRPDQKNAVVVDTQKARLYLYQNDSDNGGPPRFVADYYISHGKLGAEKFKEGDKKTPVGVYHVTSTIPRQKLTDFYGTGAFPINYPNEWDKKMGRNGHGIWLHGTPSDTFSRPPKASDGCVVLANADLDALAKNLQVGTTPVIISNSIEWLSLDDWQAERKALLGMIDAWRRDWESLDIDRYARHYARDFASDGKDLAAWIEQKKKVNAAKQWIKVATENVSMFRNPGKDEYVVVTFEQDYQSSNLSNRMQKRQYWIKEDGRWKIAFEGAA